MVDGGAHLFVAGPLLVLSIEVGLSSVGLERSGNYYNPIGGSYAGVVFGLIVIGGAYP